MDIGIYVDGRLVGAAEEARLDPRRGKVTVRGLDALANLFFSSWVAPIGPGAPRDQVLGWVVLQVMYGDWIEAPEAFVFSFSSGTGDLVLVSAGARLLPEAPPLHP